MSSKDKPKKKVKGRNSFCYNFIRLTGAIPVLFWLRPKTVYCGNGKKTRIKGGAIVVSNHVAMTDPLSILCAFWYRVPRFVVAKELFDTKRKKAFFTMTYCIGVDRDNFNMNAFHAISDELAQKKMVVVFPEGQINTTESASPLPFKSGVILMAHKNKVPIVPVYIVKRERKLQRSVVLIGDPIDVVERIGQTPSLAAIDEVSEELRAAEAELLEKYLNKKRR